MITQPSPTQPLSRDQMVAILKIAVAVGERKYARRIALAWLAFFPGDLEISLLHAEALLQEDNPLSLRQALHILDELCTADPEFLQAQIELTKAKIALGIDSVADSIGYEIGLGNKPITHPRGYTDKVPKWASDIYNARKNLHFGFANENTNTKEAEKLIHRALIKNSNNPLIAVTHVRIMTQNKSLSTLGLQSLVEAYHNRWPKCIHFILYLAHSHMEIGDSERAVSLLHKAASADILGHVAIRIWGENHPYKTLWPKHIELTNTGINTPQNIPIPASVATVMGWNQLPEVSLRDSGRKPDDKSNINSGDHFIPEEYIKDNRTNPTTSITESHKLEAETVHEAWKEFKTLTAKLILPDLKEMDGRYPIYVILTTRMGLIQKYGNDKANIIHKELNSLVKVIKGNRIGHRTWGSILFCPDDSESMVSLGINPVPHNDPWGLKLSLSDLDNLLGKRGEMIGAVLIIGGHDVVPFHHLPNPVDDDDPDVPSDNPYATRDENYFVQEWPIGRLPGSTNGNAEFLLYSIRSLRDRYAEDKKSNPWYLRLWKAFIDAIWPPFNKIQPSLGYSAAVWQRASLSVFRTIGQPRSLLISPPIKSCDPPGRQTSEKDSSGDSICITLNPSVLAYFNLHGLQDSAEWYGQSDPIELIEGPDFPVALRPQDIVNGGRAPNIVFSEACYGAHITGKKLEEAIALKFLASGSQCVIGSSCISYGSIRTPLIGADLLGHAFWKYLKEGMPVGEALRHSKIHLINEMNKRQGFLDGEDQKTLISFVLYGDPLSLPRGANQKSKLITRSTTTQHEVKTVCARTEQLSEPSPVPAEILSHVKHVVSHYLPGMKNAEMNISSERTGCQNACRNCLSGNLCPTAQLGPKNFKNNISERRVVTLSKSISKGALAHKQFAHITLDPNGKVLKLAVSR